MSSTKRPRRPARSLADVPPQELARALRTESLRTIARRYGVARNTVRYWRAQLGIPGPAVPAPRGPRLQPQLRAYLQQHPEGATTAECCQRCQDSAAVVYRALCRLEAAGHVYRTLEQLPDRWHAQQ